MEAITVGNNSGGLIVGQRRVLQAVITSGEDCRISQLKPSEPQHVQHRLATAQLPVLAVPGSWMRSTVVTPTL